MRFCLCLFLLLSLLPAIAGDEQKIDTTVLKTPIVGVDLFKNGYCVVTRRVFVPAIGTWTLDCIPAPVHGTFWINSGTASVTLTSGVHKVKSSEMPKLPPLPGGDSVNSQPNYSIRRVSGINISHPQPDNSFSLNRALSGQEAVVVLGGEEQQKAVLSGIIMECNNDNLVLKTKKGTIVLNRYNIVEIRVPELNMPEINMVEAPVYILRAIKPKENKNFPVEIRYVAYGMSWAPSYLVEINDERTLRIEQKCVIKNEMEDVFKIKTRLITGYPGIRFAGMPSLIDAGVSINKFLTMADNSRVDNGSISSNRIVCQQVSQPFPGGIPGNNNGNEGDLYFHDMGELTLKRGEAMAMSVEWSTADYERIVEWEIPDSRDDRGRYLWDNRAKEAKLWNSLSLHNPFTFPMTTAAVSFYEKGDFLGENIANYAASGEKICLKINRALSVRAESTEKENLADRKRLSIAGNNVEKRMVKAVMSVKNTRKKKVKMFVRRKYSGMFVNSSLKPDENRLLEGGAYMLNPQGELLWVLDLDPGIQKDIEFSYEVLVDI